MTKISALALAIMLLTSPLLAQGSSSFDGGDWYNCDDWDVSTTITIAAWVCPTTEDGTREDIVVKEGTGNSVTVSYNYRMNLFGLGNNTYKVQFEFRDSGNNLFQWRSDTVTPAKATDCSAQRQWFHVAVTYDQSSAPIFYINGTSSTATQISGATNGTMGASNIATRIGGRSSGTEQFHGNIAHVAVGQYIASAGEINSLVVQPFRARGGANNNVVALWDSSPHNYAGGGLVDCLDPTGTGNDPAVSTSAPPVKFSG